MLLRLKITDLFGIKGNDKEIEFKEKLNILVGQNGAGKTTILNILNVILTKTFRSLFEYKFNTIQLEAIGGIIFISKFKEKLIVKRLDIENVAKEFSISEDVLLSIKKKIKNNEFILTKFEDENINENFQEFISKVYIEISREDKPKFENKVYQEFDLDINSIYFPTYRRLETDFSKLINQIESNEHMGRSYLFNKNLSFFENPIENNVVLGFSNKDISEIIAKKWREVSFRERRYLNSLIEKFIVALIDVSAQADIEDIASVNLDKLKNALEEAFQRTGLNRNIEMKKQIDNFVNEIAWAQQFMDTMNIENENNKNKKNKKKAEKEEEIRNFLRYSRVGGSFGRITQMLKMYRDVCNKIEKIKAPFEELQEILGSFLKKKVEIKEDIKFINGKTELLFEDLSAGEKQLVSLFVYTRLQTKSRSIVLIDEPELSLHVSWQRKFLENLLENNSSQYILSTHSPFIISKYGNNVIKIGALDDEGDYSE